MPTELQNDAFFRKMMEQAPVAISILIGPNFVLQSANKMQFELWQRHPDEVLNKQLFDILPEVESQEFKRLLSDVYRTGVPYKATDKPAQFLRNGTLETAWFDFNYEPLRNDMGDVEGIMVVSVEVTEKVLAYQKAQASDAFSRTVLESSPDCMKVLDCDGRLQYMNANGMCLMEVDDFCVIEDKPWWELWPPESQDLVKASVQKAFEGTGVQFQAFCPTANGTPKWWDVRVSPLRNAKGVITRLITVSRDITDRKQLAENLRVQYDELQTIYRYAPIGLAMVDKDCRFVRINERLAEINGLPAKDHINRSIDDIVPSLAEQAKAVFQQIFQTGQPLLNVEIRGETRAKPGVERIWNESWHPVKNDAGETVAVSIVVEEVTEKRRAEDRLRESEERFRTMSEHSPVWIWMTDKAVNISYANREMLSYLGLGHYSEFTGHVWERLTHPDDIQQVYEAFNDAAARQEAFSFESRVKNATNGVFEWCLFRGVPHRQNGGFVGFIGTGIQIHERKLMVETLERLVQERTAALERSNKELQRSNEDLQQFVHVSSHDLKEPVRKVLTFASRLEAEFADNLSEQAILYLAKINTAARRSYDMIEGVLHYSMLSTTQGRVEKVDLQAILQAIEADLEVPIAKKGAVLVYSDLPTVEGYRHLLYQLFYNLVGNALKFAKAGVPPRITLNTQKTDPNDLQRLDLSGDDHFVYVRVADNGIGFNPRYARRVFETFAQLNAKNQYEGTGLGLTLCKKIVERHGGAIEAEGSEGEGAVFSIYLPLYYRGEGKKEL